MAYLGPISASEMPRPPAMPPNQGRPTNDTLFGRVLDMFGDPSLAALPAGGMSLGMNPKMLPGLMDTLRHLSGKSALPTTENAASLMGGIHAGGQGLEGVKAGLTPIADVAAMPEAKAMDTLRRSQDYATQGGRPITSEHFTSAGPSGGMVPDLNKLDPSTRKKIFDLRD